MDLDAVCKGLAAAAATITGLRGSDYLPDDVEVPVFVVGVVDVDYEQTFGTDDEYSVTCRLLLSRADDRTGQQQLRPYISRTGSKSIKTALEADRTLGGVCDDLVVKRARAPLTFTVGADSFFGAEFTVTVIGD